MYQRIATICPNKSIADPEFDKTYHKNAINFPKCTEIRNVMLMRKQSSLYRVYFGAHNTTVTLNSFTTHYAKQANQIGTWDIGQFEISAM